VNRRTFVTGLGAVLAAPLGAEAQRAAATPRIGYLTPSSQSRGIASVNYFRDALRERGYIDGTNVVIEPRFADGYERVPAFLAELLNLKVDVLVVTGTTVAVAAQHATSTVPIVFAPAADPVGSGLVASLSRPGGNITGYTDIPTELSQKSLGLLSELVPHMSRVGVLSHADNPGSRIVINAFLSKRCRGVPQSSQNVASARFSRSHREHFMPSLETGPGTYGRRH
jgi:putative tryptophan/tyrosine transport system substrate-binding protein